jgi:hypothetical protein
LCVKKTIALMINGGVGEWLGRSNGGRAQYWALNLLLRNPQQHNLANWEWEKMGSLVLVWVGVALFGSASLVCYGRVAIRR